MSRNHNKFSELKTFQKIFLLSNYLKESKPQKNWFANKFNQCLSSIRNDVDFITKERRLENLKKKYKGNSFSNKKNTILIDINKFNHRFNSKGNKYYLKKINSKKMIKNLDNIEENENNISNINNIEHDHEKNNSFFSKNKSVDPYINTPNENQKLLNLKIDLNTLPNITQVENKNKYITNYINNISEKTDLLEKKLIKQEKNKYIRFKTKYNRLFNEYSKVKLDTDQYIDPDKDKKYKFKLNDSNGETMGNVQKVMRQISNKIKNLHQNKPSMNDIINEVEQFKCKEKRLRDRLQRSHEKFDYLIKDSNMIQKRIDIKCQ